VFRHVFVATVVFLLILMAASKRHMHRVLLGERVSILVHKLPADWVVDRVKPCLTIEHGSIKHGSITLLMEALLLKFVVFD